MLRILKISIETNLFIALAAVSFLWANIYLLGISHQHLAFLSLQVFFSTWFVYQISRWVYYKKGQYTNENELVVQWFRRYPKFNEFTIYTSGIIAIVLMLFLQWKTIIILCFIGAISVLYPVPIFKIFGIETRLRDFPFVKIFLIALVWSVTSVVLPATELNIDLSDRKDIWLVLVAQFIYILFITLPFDINDADVDKVNNMKTIPVVFGIKTSKYICLVLGIIYSLLVLYIFMIENWRVINAIYLTEATIIAIWLLMFVLQVFTFFKSDKLPKWLIKVIYDGSMIVYFFILFFTVK
jgi:4-hydroxybenzoate polyprenyltransferase